MALAAFRSLPTELVQALRQAQVTGRRVELEISDDGSRQPVAIHFLAHGTQAEMSWRIDVRKHNDPTWMAIELEATASTEPQTSSAQSEELSSSNEVQREVLIREVCVALSLGDMSFQSLMKRITEKLPGVSTQSVQAVLSECCEPWERSAPLQLLPDKMLGIDMQHFNSEAERRQAANHLGPKLKARGLSYQHLSSIMDREVLMELAISGGIMSGAADKGTSKRPREVEHVEAVVLPQTQRDDSGDCGADENVRIVTCLADMDKSWEMGTLPDAKVTPLDSAANQTVATVGAAALEIAHSTKLTELCVSSSVASPGVAAADLLLCAQVTADRLRAHEHTCAAFRRYFASCPPKVKDDVVQWVSLQQPLRKQWLEIYHATHSALELNRREERDRQYLKQLKQWGSTST